MSYEEIWSLQKKRLEEIARDGAAESLIFCEHELSITSGKRAREQNLLVADKQVPVHQIERGGDLTLHAPGQLVIYPLFKLGGRLLPKGIHGYLRFLEEAIIQVLTEEYQLKAGRFGPTGVWVKDHSGRDRKIASIGIAVRKWVTYHGAALNVRNDLEEFRRIRPCDFDSSVMTSLQELGVEVSLEEVSEQIEWKMLELVRPRLETS